MKLSTLGFKILALSAVALSLSAGSCESECDDSASLKQSAQTGNMAAQVKLQDAINAAQAAGRTDCAQIGLSAQAGIDSESVPLI